MSIRRTACILLALGTAPGFSDRVRPACAGPGLSGGGSVPSAASARPRGEAGRARRTGTRARLARPAGGQAVASEPYAWHAVPVVGGGFVTGIVFHPGEPGLAYARTDIGGAYRRDSAHGRWQPLLDWLGYGDRNLMGVESIAIDPSDPDRVYLAVGTYTAPDVPDGAVLRSEDRGRTFRRTDMPVKFGGNENGRGNGERMAVDPNDGRVIYLGTRHDGLWRSVDRGATWARVESFPDVRETGVAGAGPRSLRGGRGGVVFVVFDPRSGGDDDGSATIWAGASLRGRPNLFRSTDGGESWAPVPGQPTANRPNHAVLGGDGTLYVSYGSDPGPSPMTDGAVWKLDTATGEWTDITPEPPSGAEHRGFGYAAVEVDPQDPDALLASTFGRPGGEELYRSTDGGESWVGLFHGEGPVGEYDASGAPYVMATGIHWLFDVEIDPFDPGHALFTTGYGGWETFDLTDADRGAPTRWTVYTAGIEETVPLALLAPPGPVQLITGIGDYGGFLYTDFDGPPRDMFVNPRLGNTSDLAMAALRPGLVVRVGRPFHGRGAALGWSEDGGRTWRPAASGPAAGAEAGTIAVSADGGSWVWTPRGMRPHVTSDRGRTWREVDGLPPDTRVVADPLSPGRLYAMDLFGGRLFVSDDGGARFDSRPLRLPGGLPDPPATRGARGDLRGGQDRLYAAPGRSGELWLPAFDGLYRSTDAGASFDRLAGVEEIHAFGFGHPAPGTDYPTLYLVGVVEGVRGIFRSDDIGATWVRINDDAHQWGLILLITGDPDRYGRVYVGTHGRGALRGEPAA